MNIRKIETEADFFALKDNWNKLAENLMPINKFEWMEKWWKHNKTNNKLNILIVEDNNEILGIAPLYINNTKAFKIIQIKQLCWLGGEISDYLDFIIKQDERHEEIFKFLFEYIFDELNADEICFRQINNNYPNFDLWEKYTKLRKLDFKPYRECWRINLGEFSGYDEYFSQLSKSHKRSIKARHKKLNTEVKDYEFIFKKDISPDDIDTVSRINITRQKYLYEEKCKGKRFCYFVDKQKTDFIYDYFVNSDLKDKFFTALKCNGKIASYILCLTHKDNLYLWNMAFDPEFEFCAPTKILVNEAIKYAFENNYKYFDFMRGNDPYKLKWCNDTAFCYSLFEPKSLKSKLIKTCRDLKPDYITKLFNKPNIKNLLDEAYEEKCES